jgi:alpha/beta superfamily hydrolase
MFMDFRFYQEVDIPLGTVTVTGELIIPKNANSIIIFSHGSGSSRFSKRNQLVANYLQSKNFGTLLFDLLTSEEDRDYHTRFDIDLLTTRLAGATKWLKENENAEDCCIGYFGASTGAASALRAAAIIPNIGAVVSRGGRPDMAMDYLDEVHSPTLLIVGSRDEHVLQLNKKAFAELQCEKKLEIVYGASHLFEESGKMEIVSELAANWFEKFLKPKNALILN